MTQTPNRTFELRLTGTNVPHAYRAFVPGSDGQPLAEHAFELRNDTAELTLTLAGLAKAATSGEKPGKDEHVAFGKRLFSLVFAGPVGKLWTEKRKEAGRTPLALVLRIEPATARFLVRLPWEYLHDGKDFLATQWRTPVYRLPWGVDAAEASPLDESLRMLVVIASPSGLNENEVLHFAREEDLILAATAEARKSGKLRLEFAPNARLETLEDYLADYRPHLLHFVGHGVFVDAEDSGLLLMEDARGHKREVWNRDFARALAQCRDLRGVFLSACQSAVAARTDGFVDLASRLLEDGLPLVAAMQYSVLNLSAMAFGSVFYKGIADGKLAEDAFTLARQRLQNTSPNSVDFATPVLYLADPGCLQTSEQTSEVSEVSATPLDLGGLTKAQNFVGRAVEIRDLQTALDPVSGKWRAAVVHALGGMGKTVLAARLAERMAPRFDGVVSLRMTPATTAQGVLDHIGDFLLAHNARFNNSKAHAYQQARHTPMALQSRAGLLADVLCSLKLLVIFDNCEDILPQGKEVSRAAQGAETPASLDPELLPLIGQLAGSVDGPSRFLFTSRVDFPVVEENRLADAIGHLALKEMGFREAVYLMETLPPLDGLPAAVLANSPLLKGEEPGVRSLSMREIYARLGGHPYRLGLFAKHAGRSSVQRVLDDLGGVEREMLDFTLLKKAVNCLPERAARLATRAAVYEEPVPVEGLAFMIGAAPDVMPDIPGELEALLNWGLLANEPGTPNYSLHSLVRDWAKSQWTEENRKEYLRRAATYWLGVGRDSHDLGDHLRARHYLYEAGEYEQADDIVQNAYDYLLRWGQWGLLLWLLRQSADSLQGNSKAVALGNLATVLMSLGDYQTAAQYYQQVLPLFEGPNAKSQKAATLHQIGMIHQDQGEYGRALEFTQQSLKIKEEIGDRAGVARSLHQIGNLYYLQGEYGRALEFYQGSGKILKEIGDRAGVAASLHQIGMLHHDQGEYGRALEFYQQSLKIKEEIGDRAGLARSLHQIGNLYYLQGEYGRALEFYQQSGKILEEIGDRAGAAQSLHQIGMIHQVQGEYGRALEFYQRALKIAKEIGDRAGVASSLHQIGMLHHDQGEYGRALEFYQQSGKILEEIGDRAGVAKSLHQIGMLHHDQGEYGQALEFYQGSGKILEEIGDRAGVAKSLHQIGNLHYLQGEYGRALEFYQQSGKILEEIGDRAGVASSLSQIGIVIQAQGNYKEALDHQQKSLVTRQEIGDRKGVSICLHQIGMIHQDQGEYGRALEFYQGSLKIREEIGDRAGVANSCGQLGLLYEQTGQLQEAVQSLAKAFLLFAGMGAPQARQALGFLSRLMDKIGEGEFTEALQSSGLPPEAQAAILQTLSGQPPANGQGEKQPDLRQVLIGNTVAVMTQAKDKKGEWWEALRRLQAQAKEAGETDLAAYAAVLQRLVEGAAPSGLSAGVPEEFREDWQAILEGIG